jgi:hypothetical protein
LLICEEHAVQNKIRINASSKGLLEQLLNNVCRLSLSDSNQNNTASYHLCLPSSVPMVILLLSSNRDCMDCFPLPEKGADGAMLF